MYDVLHMLEVRHIFQVWMVLYRYFCMDCEVCSLCLCLSIIIESSTKIVRSMIDASMLQPKRYMKNDSKNVCVQRNEKVKTKL
jgi:hypothetical protein